MARLDVRENDVNMLSNQIKEGKPVVLHICDENMEWMLVKAIVSEKPIENGEPVNILTEMSGKKEDKLYIKILEELHDVAIEESREPWEKESTEYSGYVIKKKKK